MQCIMRVDGLYLPLYKLQLVSMEFISRLKFSVSSQNVFGNMRTVLKVLKMFNLWKFTNFSRKFSANVQRILMKFLQIGLKFPEDNFRKAFRRKIGLKISANSKSILSQKSFRYESIRSVNDLHGNIHNKIRSRAFSRQGNRLILKIPILQGLVRMNSKVENMRKVDKSKIMSYRF